MQRQFKDAVRKTATSKPASCITMRHSFASCLPQNGTDIRTVQDLFRHADISTTMIYLHVIKLSEVMPGTPPPSQNDTNLVSNMPINPTFQPGWRSHA